MKPDDLFYTSQNWHDDRHIEAHRRWFAAAIRSHFPPGMIVTIDFGSNQLWSIGDPSLRDCLDKFANQLPPVELPLRIHTRGGTVFFFIRAIPTRHNPGPRDFRCHVEVELDESTTPTNCW